MRRYRILWLALMIPLLLAAAWWWAREDPDQPRPVATIAPQPPVPTPVPAPTPALPDPWAALQAAWNATEVDAAALSSLNWLAKPDVEPSQREFLLGRLAEALPRLSAPAARAVMAYLTKAPLSPAERERFLATLPQLDGKGRRLPLARAMARPEISTEALTPLLRDADPRVRAAAATALRAQSSPTAAAAVAQAQAQEPDPRVRAALEGHTPPRFAEDARSPVALPAASERARPLTIETQWDRQADGSHLNTSTVIIAADGSATVETVSVEGYHVRYPAHAWRDAAGNLIIDGRQQPVEYLKRPDLGRWWPDSLTIKPDGTTDLIDDLQQGRDGATGMPGDG